MRLGPFELGDVLGRGASGTVHAATHVRSGFPAAVKRVRGVDWDLGREIRTTAGLDHRHVVRILDHGVDDGGRWFAMERGTGTLSGVRLSTFQDVRTVLLQILDGLAHAHARGVLHRDLKPSNVLVGCRRAVGEVLDGPAPGLRLADFGIAWDIGDTDAVQAGSAGFVAPEQRAGDVARFGPWTDLFALGRVAEVLAGGLGVPIGFADWVAWLRHPAIGTRCGYAVDAARGLLALGDPATHAPAVEVALPPTLALVTQTVQVDEALPAPEAPSERVQVPLPDAPWTTGRAWPSTPLLDAGIGLLALREPGFRGRRDELKALWDALRDVEATGRTRVIRLDGPPGVGRTRLARQLHRRAHELGGRVGLWVDRDLRGALARVPFADIDPDARDVIRAWLTDRGPVPIGAFAALPVTLIHVEDPADLAILKRWPRPVLVTLDAGVDWDHAGSLTVPPLPESDRIELLRVDFGLDPKLAEALALDCDADLAALTARVHRLARDGLRVGPAGFTRAPGAVDTPIGTDAIDILPTTSDRRLAWMLALVRLRLPDPRALGDFDALSNLGWIDEDPRGARIASWRLREALRASCEDPVPLHRILAEHFIRAEEPIQAAHHWFEAGRPDQSWPLIAPELAKDFSSRPRGERRHLVSLAKAVLDAAGRPAGHPDRLRVQVASHLMTVTPEEWAAELEEAQALCEQALALGETAIAVGALIGAVQLALQLGRNDAALALGRRAWSLAARSIDRAEVAYAYGWALLESGKLETARPLLEEGLALAESIEPASLSVKLAVGLRKNFAIGLVDDEPARALAVATDAVSAAPKRHGRRIEALAGGSWVASIAGAPSQALLWIEEAAELARVLGASFLEANMHLMTSDARWDCDDPEGALQSARRALELGTASGRSILPFRLHYAHLTALTGDVDALATLLDAIDADDPALDHRKSSLLAWLELSRRLLRGDAVDASALVPLEAAMPADVSRERAIGRVRRLCRQRLGAEPDNS